MSLRSGTAQAVELIAPLDMGTGTTAVSCLISEVCFESVSGLLFVDGLLLDVFLFGPRLFADVLLFGLPPR